MNFKNFNEERMVSKLDSRLKQMVLNQKPKMKDETILQQMQKNPTMDEEDVNLACVFLVDVDEPHFFMEALNGEDSQHWKKAMDFKFQFLQNNKTWILTPLPLNYKPMSCIWIFKIKYNFNSFVTRHKIHLVAKGSTQVKDIEFNKIFSHVAGMESI
jgi:hypothetical protein